MYGFVVFFVTFFFSVFFCFFFFFFVFFGGGGHDLQRDRNAARFTRKVIYREDRPRLQHFFEILTTTHWIYIYYTCTPFCLGFNSTATGDK